MDALIRKIVGQLGLSDHSAAGAVRVLLREVEGQTEPREFDRLLDVIPGARDLVETPRRGSNGTVANGSPESLRRERDPSSVMDELIVHEIDPDDVGALVGLFCDYVSKNAGRDFVQDVLGKVPAIRIFVG